MKSSSFAKSVKLRLILDAPSTMTTRRRCLPDFMRFIPNFLTLFGDPSKLLLIVFPIQKFSFSLHKGAFHDTLSLISLVSTIIAALKLCILEHIFSGYLSIRHNWALWYYCFPTIWSVPQCEHQTSIANPWLGKYKALNSAGDAHLDVSAMNFWGTNNKQNIRVFNPFAKSHVRNTLPQCYHEAELEKRCAYDMRAWEVEHGSFSPLVFFYFQRSWTNSYSCIQTYCFADELDEAIKLFRLCCKIGFSLCSAIMHGSWSSYHHPLGPLQDHPINCTCSASQRCWCIQLCTMELINFSLLFAVLSKMLFFNLNICRQLSYLNLLKNELTEMY